MELTFYKDNGGKWRWRVIADNGKIVGASSQGFASKQMAGENADLLNDALTNCNNGG
jgi:uncharacterized protein YegP (UPF0339 family)